MTVDGETGVMQLQAKEWQPMPAITTSSKEARKDAPLHVSEDMSLKTRPYLAFGLLACRNVRQ